MCINQLAEDVLFLESGFKEAQKEYEKLDYVTTSEEIRKTANWNVVEFLILLQQSQKLKQNFQDQLPKLQKKCNIKDWSSQPLAMWSVIPNCKSLKKNIYYSTYGVLLYVKLFFLYFS